MLQITENWAMLWNSLRKQAPQISEIFLCSQCWWEQSDFYSSPFNPSRFTEPVVSRKALCASAEPTPYHTASQRVQTAISWRFLGLRVAMFQCGYKNPLAVWINKCLARCNFPQVHKAERIFIVNYDGELGHQWWLWCYLCWLSGTCWSLPVPWLLWSGSVIIS